jgi:tRNA-specific 2-thiouridylase
MRFPLGELTKDRVRAIAAEHGLAVANKPDSQDLCFLAGTGRARFLERHGGIGDRPGPIVDRRGNELGRHRGAHRFTVGQRRGLEIGGASEPLYVLGTDTAARTVTVGPRAELATTEVALGGVVLHRGPEAVEAVKLRYRSPAVPCTLDGDTLRLAEPFAGAAPGQVAVLLRGDAIVGSGTIRS